MAIDYPDPLKKLNAEIAEQVGKYGDEHPEHAIAVVQMLMDNLSSVISRFEPEEACAGVIGSVLRDLPVNVVKMVQARKQAKNKTSILLPSAADLSKFSR